MQLQVKAEMLILCEDMTSDHRPKILKKIEEIPNMKERWFNWTTLRGISFIYHSFNKITCYLQIVSMIKCLLGGAAADGRCWAASSMVSAVTSRWGSSAMVSFVKDLLATVGGSYGLAIDHGELMDMEQFELACVVGEGRPSARAGMRQSVVPKVGEGGGRRRSCG
nr:uncharacterized protein LOC127293635 [Lolium perenne]